MVQSPVGTVQPLRAVVQGLRVVGGGRNRRAGGDQVQADGDEDGEHRGEGEAQAKRHGTRAYRFAAQAARPTEPIPSLYLGPM
jgi:hypothetical protein